MSEITKELLDSYINRLADKIDTQSNTFNIQMKAMNDNFDLKLEIIDGKVDQTLEQAQKTNGRVTLLETKPHPIANCPQATVISKLKDDMLATETERKFTMKMAAAIATVIGIVISALGLLI